MPGVFRLATRIAIVAAAALAVASGSGAAMRASADHHRHFGTISAGVEFYGNTGQALVTVLTQRGRRVARHVVDQNVPNFQGLVHSTFVLKPGRYTVRLTPHRQMWFECQTQATVGVEARTTSDVPLGYPCAIY